MPDEEHGSADVRALTLVTLDLVKQSENVLGELNARQGDLEALLVILDNVKVTK